jgi:pimeloyl-ACP methyl ester carboxylesterase
VARLARRTWGRDPGRRRHLQPLAVLVHGITSSSLTWWRVGPALAERGWSVVAVDLRGHGASPRGQAGLGLADLAADVAQTVRRRPVDLLAGHSLGALTAMALLGAEPGFARRVVLEDPPCLEALDLDRMVADIERDARRARTDPDGLRAELLAPPWSFDPGDADARVASLASLDVAAVTAELRRAVLDLDVAELARGVRIPTLLLLGREELGSMLVGEARAAATAALHRGWTEVVDCGHSIHREAFDDYIGRLEVWLDRVAARPPVDI